MIELRYGFIFKFKDGGWNIIMFDEDWDYYKYYTCDEHNYDDAIAHINDYVVDSSSIRQYEIPTYDEFCKVVSGSSIFELPNEDIAGFESYMCQ